jgi:hypothetical protein
MDVDAEADRREHAAAGGPVEGERRVQDFISHRLDRLTQRLAVDKDQPIGPDAMGEARFLRDLAWLNTQRPATRSRRQRLLMPLLFVATASTVTALVAIRLPSIRIDGDVLCSSLTLRVATPIQLTGLSPLLLFQASEFAAAQLEDISGAVLPLTPPVELRPSVSGGVTLSSLGIPGGSALSIERTGDTNTWRLAVAHDDATAAATLTGTVDVSADGSTRAMPFGRGMLVSLHAGGSDPARLDLLVTPQRVESLLAGRRIPVEGLVFEEAVQEALPGEFGIVQGRASSVLEGSIFNVALGGRELSLRARDAVEMQLTSGDVRELRLEAGGIRVSFSGEAEELRIGRFGGLQTMRPSYLEWLAEHHSLKLAWGGAAWVFALFLGGMRWWQGSGS